MSRAVLVTGATGRQGGAVISALLTRPSDNFMILAVTRDVSGSRAQMLNQSPSIRLVEGDLNDVPKLFEEAQRVAEQPIWGVYSVQVSMGKDVTTEGEIRQGKALIDESIKAGVKHFVYSSVERGGDEKSWKNRTPIPHFQTKYEIEHYLFDVTAQGKQGEKMGWTILRPVAVSDTLVPYRAGHLTYFTIYLLRYMMFLSAAKLWSQQFMDNLTPGFPTKVFLAALRNWLGDKPLQWVAVRDIGNFAVRAFRDTEKWNHRAIGLAGEQLTMDELSRAFESGTGEPAPVAYSFFGSALTFAVSEVRLMIGWFASEGYNADVEARRKDFPDMLTFREWLDIDSSFDTVEW